MSDFVRAPADLGAQLKALGFKFTHKPDDPGDADFSVFDDSDGRGPYIRYWFSAQPCPFPEYQRDPILTPPTPEHLEELNRDRVIAAANNKEVADMAKAAEIVAEAIATVDRHAGIAAVAIEAVKTERDEARGLLAAAERRIAELEAGEATVAATLKAVGVDVAALKSGKLQTSVDAKTPRE